MPDQNAATSRLGAQARRRLRRWVDVAVSWLPPRVRELAQSIDRGITMRSSSLAFYGLVSALPTLLISFTVVEAVAGEHALREFADRAAQQGPEGSGEFLDQLVASGGSLTWVTVLFTVWPATAYGGGLRRAMLRSVPEDGRLPGLRGRLLGLSVVVALPVLMLTGVPLMFVVTTLSGDGVLATLVGWGLAILAGTAIGTAMTTLLYKAFSPGSLGWRKTLQGAAVTAAVTAVFSVLFVVYLNVGQTQERFGGGTVALVVLLGVWLFVANTVLLAGYEAVLELDPEHGSEPSSDAGS